MADIYMSYNNSEMSDEEWAQQFDWGQYECTRDEEDTYQEHNYTIPNNICSWHTKREQKLFESYMDDSNIVIDRQYSDDSQYSSDWITSGYWMTSSDWITNSDLMTSMDEW